MEEEKEKEKEIEGFLQNNEKEKEEKIKNPINYYVKFSFTIT